jgi:hypothetical protein
MVDYLFFCSYTLFKSHIPSFAHSTPVGESILSSEASRAGFLVQKEAHNLPLQGERQ